MSPVMRASAGLFRFGRATVGRRGERYYRLPQRLAALVRGGGPLTLAARVLPDLQPQNGKLVGRGSLKRPCSAPLRGGGWWRGDGLGWRTFNDIRWISADSLLNSIDVLRLFLQLIFFDKGCFPGTILPAKYSNPYWFSNPAGRIFNGVGKRPIYAESSNLDVGH
jgi:hypothetical protein